MISQELSNILDLKSNRITKNVIIPILFINGSDLELVFIY